ncbi:MAG: MATE family efflux transporter [Acetivibrio sp.]
MRLENNLDSEDVKTLVFRLAIPSMLAQFVSVFYSIVDRMYIGNIPEIGEKALAGVGICGPIVTLISSFAFLVGIGGAPLLSISLGRKDEKMAKKVLANSFLLLSVLSIFLTIAAFLVKDWLLINFGASEGIFSYADEYMSIYLLGTVFALLAIGMNQFIICQGFAKVGMKSVLIGAVLNIVLDPIFIFAFDMGVKGAAYATIISQAISCMVVLCFLFGKKIPIGITFHGYSLKVMGKIGLLGMTPFLIIAFDNILIISLNSVISKYGGNQTEMLLTCTTIVQSFMLMITMPLGGITGGTQTILGFNYGASRPDRIKKAFKWISLLCLLFTGTMFLFAQTIPQYFARIFTGNPLYIEQTVWIIRRYTIGVIPLGIQYMIIDGLTGMGLAKYSITLSMLRKALFFAGVFLLPKIFGIFNVFYTEPISDIIGTLCSILVFFLLVKPELERLKKG